MTLSEMNDVHCGNVESLAEEIATLVAERQELRSSSATREQLERNRRRIAELQWQLSHALIGRYLPQAA